MSAITDLENDIEECKTIKRRLSGASGCLSIFSTKLNNAHNILTGNNSKSLDDWAYTDNNMKDSIDRGLIKEVIGKVSTIQGNITSLNSKIDKLITNKEKKLKDLKDKEKK